MIDKRDLDWKTRLHLEGWTPIDKAWVMIDQICVVGNDSVILRSGTVLRYGPNNTAQSVRGEIITWWDDAERAAQDAKFQ